MANLIKPPSASERNGSGNRFSLLKFISWSIGITAVLFLVYAISYWGGVQIYSLTHRDVDTEIAGKVEDNVVSQSNSSGKTKRQSDSQGITEHTSGMLEIGRFNERAKVRFKGSGTTMILGNTVKYFQGIESEEGAIPQKLLFLEGFEFQSPQGFVALVDDDGKFVAVDGILRYKTVARDTSEELHVTEWTVQKSDFFWTYVEMKEIRRNVDIPNDDKIKALVFAPTLLIKRDKVDKSQEILVPTEFWVEFELDTGETVKQHSRFYTPDLESED